MTMIQLQLELSYKIILQNFTQKQLLPKVTSCKPHYIFCEAQLGLQEEFGLSCVCLYYVKVLYFIRNEVQA